MGWFCVALGLLPGLYALINPKSLWYATEAWTYRNPEANEPCDASYATSQVALAVSSLVIIALGLCINIQLSRNILGVTNARAAAEDLTGQIRRASPLNVWADNYGSRAKPGNFWFELPVQTAPGRIDQRAKIELVKAAHIANIHRYTLSGERNQSSCLTMAESTSADLMVSSYRKPGEQLAAGKSVIIEAYLSDGTCGH